MEEEISDIPPVLWISGPPGSPKNKLAQKLNHEITNRKTQLLTEDTINKYSEIPENIAEEKLLKRVKHLALTAKLLQQNNIIPIFSSWLPFESQLNFSKKEIKNIHYIIIEVPLEKYMDTTNNDYKARLLNTAVNSNIGSLSGDKFKPGLTLPDTSMEKMLNRTLEYLDEKNLVTSAAAPDSEEVVDRLKNIGYI
ncbi:MAG: adenylyl-sulfate kinase [bacterium]